MFCSVRWRLASVIWGLTCEVWLTQPRVELPRPFLNYHWTWMLPQRTGLSDQGPERTVFLTLLLTCLLQRLFEHGILVDPLSLGLPWPIWGLACSPCLGEDVWPFLGIALSLRPHLQLPLSPPSSMRISTLLGLGTDGKECWQSNPERSPHYLEEVLPFQRGSRHQHYVVKSANSRIRYLGSNFLSTFWFWGKMSMPVKCGTVKLK